MISQTILKRNDAQSGARLARYYAAAEYYSARDLGSEWLGDGAEKFGLNGPNRDSKKDLDRLLKGRDPNTGHKLGKATEKAGIDITLNPPKAFSCVWALADDSLKAQIVQKHKEARDLVLNAIMEIPLAEKRKGKDKDGNLVRVFEKCKSITFRTVTHVDTRAGDVHLHEHCLLLPKVQASDGSWQTINNEELYRRNLSLQSLYDEAFARGLADLGFAVQVERELDGKANEKGIRYHIQGLPRELEDIQSKRAQDIQEAIDQGLASSRDEAALATRRKKEDPTPEQVLSNFKSDLETLKQQGITVPSIEQLRAQGGRMVRQWKAKDEDNLSNWLHRGKSVFETHEVVDILIKEGLAHPKEAKEKADAWIQEHCVKSYRTSPNGEPLFATKAQFEIEQHIFQEAHRPERLYCRRHALPTETIDKALSRSKFKLSEEQTSALYFTTQESGQVACIEGRAGTGKSASASVYVDAFALAGYSVIGTSTSQSATDELQSSIKHKCLNLAELSKEQNLKGIHEKSLVVFDEAGMIGAKDFKKVFDRCLEVGAKVVMIGDRKQLQPIQAGSPFAYFANVEQRTQKNYQRQKTKEGRESVALTYEAKTGAEIIQDWKKKDYLNVHSDRLELLKQFRADYFKAVDEKSGDERKSALQDRIALVNTHGEGRAITAQIRDGLKERGLLGESRKFSVQDPNKHSRSIEVEFAVGDRVRFTKNEKKHQAVNNDIGTVLGFTECGKGLRLEMNGKERSIDLRQYRNIEHAWTSTVHSAQGKTADEVFWWSEKGVNSRNTALVGLSRMRHHFKAYTTDEARLEERITDFDLKQGMDYYFDLGAKTQKPKDIEAPKLEIGKAVSKSYEKRLAPFTEAYKASIPDAEKSVDDNIINRIEVLEGRIKEAQALREKFVNEHMERDEALSKAKNPSLWSKANILAKKPDIKGLEATAKEKAEKALERHMNSISRPLTDKWERMNADQRMKFAELDHGGELAQLTSQLRGLGDANAQFQRKLKVENEAHGLAQKKVGLPPVQPLKAIQSRLKSIKERAESARTHNRLIERMGDSVPGNKPLKEIHPWVQARYERIEKQAEQSLAQMHKATTQGLHSSSGREGHRLTRGFGR